MKRYFPTMPFFFSVLLAMSGPASAAGVEAYRGSFVINPAVVHANPITGTMTVLNRSAGDDQIDHVQLDLDAAVFGHTQFVSQEQAETLDKTHGEPRLFLAFKLQGTPHKWYYVAVTESADGITFVGKIYRAEMPLADIQALFKSGLNQIPSSWKEKGAIPSLKRL